MQQRHRLADPEVPARQALVAVLGDRLSKKDNDLERICDNIEKFLQSNHVVKTSSTYEGGSVRAIVAVQKRGGFRWHRDG